MDQHKRREGGQPSLDNRPYISSLYPYLELSQNHVLGRVKRCFYVLTRIFEFKEIKSLPVWFEKCIRLNFFFYWNSRSQWKTAPNWRSTTLLKERIRHRYIPANFGKLLKTHFLKNNSSDCFCIYFFQK